MKSKQQQVSVGSPANKWQLHCRKSSGEFARLDGPSIQVRLAERFEMQAISQLLCEFEATEVRASALRLIAALRECSIRQVSTYFQVEHEITLAALILQPDTVATVAVPAAASLPLVKAA